VLDLEGPAGIDRDRRHASKGQVKCEIGDVEPALVRAELNTRRKQQALDRAVTGNAVEIALFRHDPATRIDDNDLVTLIGRDPQVVVRVHREPIGAIEAGRERHTRTGAAICLHGNLHDRVVSGVQGEQGRSPVVELDPVRAERRTQDLAFIGVGQQQIVLAGVGRRIPGRRRAAAGTGPPDNALERVRDIDVARFVEGQGIQAR